SRIRVRRAQREQRYREHDGRKGGGKTRGLGLPRLERQRLGTPKYPENSVAQTARVGRGPAEFTTSSSSSIDPRPRRSLRASSARPKSSTFACSTRAQGCSTRYASRWPAASTPSVRPFGSLAG